MAWEAAYPIVDAVLGAGAAAYEYGPAALTTIGAGYAGAHPDETVGYLKAGKKRAAGWIRDVAHPFAARKKSKRSTSQNLVPPSRATVKRDVMGLLTYRRQTQSRRGRSRRRVRRLARIQRRSAYKGSGSNLIANVFPMIFPAPDNATIREGLSSYAYYTPSLAQVVERVSANWSDNIGTGLKYSQSFSISIPKQRWDFAWTPDWANHGTTAVAAKLTVYKFVLKKKTPINDVICTPLGAAPAGLLADMCYYGSTNYAASVGSGINGLPYDHVNGIVSRYEATTNTGTTPSATQWNDAHKDPLTVFESPAFVSKCEMKWAKDFYIPNGQSMQFSCMHGPININYPDLEINRPELFVAKTATDGDNLITPFLPAGWPVFVIKVQRHTASATLSLTNFALADAMNVSHRLYYRIPGFSGRMLTYYNPNSTSLGGSTTVPRYGNVFGTTNGAGKPSAYTGLNI